MISNTLLKALKILIYLPVITMRYSLKSTLWDQMKL